MRFLGNDYIWGQGIIGLECDCKYKFVITVNIKYTLVCDRCIPNYNNEYTWIICNKNFKICVIILCYTYFV